MSSSPRSLARLGFALTLSLLAIVPVMARARLGNGKDARSRHRCISRLPRRSKKHHHAPLCPRPPRSATGTARDVSAGTATLTATVNPKGRRTTYWFQYGTSTWYGHQTRPHSAGRGRHARHVSMAVAGLAPLTTYHYRVVATTCHACRRGTIYGRDATFVVAGYQNPVYGDGEPDPYVLDNGGHHNDYWLYRTGNLFPMLHSRDLVHWSSAGTALSALPTWVVQSGDWHPWAPSVVNVSQPCPGTSSSSCYVMFYVGLSAQTDANCVAVATSTSPAGPFSDQGPLSNGTLDTSGRPIGCGDDSGFGVIDPSPFVDPATHLPYLYVSEDWACPQPSTYCTQTNGHLQPTISVIPLSSNFLQAAGPRTPLFSGDPGSWENAGTSVPTVEGPSALLHNGTYYVLYSGGNWRTTYGMGYATGPSPVGPFTKSSRNPILTRTATVLSPGGGDDLVTGPHGRTWLVYHGRSGSYAALRTLRIDPFSWTPTASGPDAPVISGPTSSPQLLTP